MKIGIISLNIGNVSSVKNMIKQLGHEVFILDKPNNSFIDAIILPGVGSFDHGINRLIETGWFSFLKNDNNIQLNKTKVLGICLGMQMLCDGSDEGNLSGLSFIPGYFKKFNRDVINLPIPHMGWNEINCLNEKYISTKFEDREPRFYFVHSYYYTHVTNDYVLSTTKYGILFASMIKNKNIFGMQFHPEKSHVFGKNLLGNVLCYQE